MVSEPGLIRGFTGLNESIWAETSRSGPKAVRTLQNPVWDIRPGSVKRAFTERNPSKGLRRARWTHSESRFWHFWRFLALFGHFGTFWPESQNGVQCQPVLPSLALCPKPGFRGWFHGLKGLNRGFGAQNPVWDIRPGSVKRASTERHLSKRAQKGQNGQKRPKTAKTALLGTFGTGSERA